MPNPFTTRVAITTRPNPQEKKFINFWSLFQFIYDVLIVHMEIGVDFGKEIARIYVSYVKAWFLQNLFIEMKIVAWHSKDRAWANCLNESFVIFLVFHLKTLFWYFYLIKFISFDAPSFISNML